MPVSFLFSSGITTPTALAAPVLDGMMFSRMPRPPRQSLLTWAVHGFLRRCGRVHGGHQTALDAPFVVQHLGHRCQAVGGAGRVGDDGLAGVGAVVHAEDEHRGVVFGRGREDDFLGAGSQVLFARGLVQEQAGGFQ